ncbi:hypothetical protein FB465_3698 [Kitasatospora atroaurantiaca]|uniref:Molecular chaperone DnaJ n=1 Tax=Kitasatospora atroaurantiaca TaxID=285545 RepID=A0A561ESN0_9ACTN|nr:hypothetical protein FB465_3698 [Kitasatospora atroaurantiaca]
MTVMATRNRPAQIKAKPCEPCKGTGQTTEAVFAGRGKRRHRVAEQEATCFDCLGSGLALPNPTE